MYCTRSRALSVQNPQKNLKNTKVFHMQWYDLSHLNNITEQLPQIIKGFKIPATLMKMPISGWNTIRKYMPKNYVFSYCLISRIKLDFWEDHNTMVKSCNMFFILTYINCVNKNMIRAFSHAIHYMDIKLKDLRWKKKKRKRRIFYLTFLDCPFFFTWKRFRLL